MPLAVQLTTDLPAYATAVGRFVFSDRLERAGVDREALARDGFEGKVDQLVTWPGDGPATVLVGLGERGELSGRALRRAGATFARAVRRHRQVALRLDDVVAEADAATAAGEPALAGEPAVAATVAGEPAGEVGPRGASPGEDPAGSVGRPTPGEVGQAVTEGLWLGAYEFLAHKSAPTPAELATVWLTGLDAEAAPGVERAATVAELVCWARDVVNEPGGSLTPSNLARAARRLGDGAGLDVKVHGRKSIRALGLGGLLGVNRGSTNPPRFIEARWRPSQPRGVVALVGKGITFDSGGLSIKTAGGMMTMKSDMAGAAAVLAATAAAARLELPVEVRAYVCATDNMTGPDAMRPGDVLRLRNGKTIEVLNTDAEGRLILADALAVASEGQPDAIVDLATLTGACRVALGSRIAGLMGNDDRWVGQVEAAAQASGEQVWRLPLPEEYRKQFESPVADMKNIGSGEAGALVAGLILQEFVGEGIPWVHLDIAGPAFVDAEDGELVKGATGFGVRLLVALVAAFERP